MDDRDVLIEHDDDRVRQVLHLARPFMDSAATSLEDLARRYLRAHAELFKLNPVGIPGEPAPAHARERDKGARLGPPHRAGITDGSAIAIVYQQLRRVHVREGGTIDMPLSLDVPLWEAGIRLVTAESPRRVLAAYSTLRDETLDTLRLARLPRKAMAAAGEFKIDPKTVVGPFIYSSSPAAPYRSPAGDRFAVLVYNRHDAQGFEKIAGRTIPYREYLDLATGTVFRREPLVSSVTGLVFTVDPHSQNARPRLGPNRPAAELDVHRTSEKLWNLTAPRSGAHQQLPGPRVYVAQDNPLGIVPPERPPGSTFDFASRRDHFAAVSAYHHCDAAFRMVEALGFNLGQFFAANVTAGKFPIRVVHRAPIGPGRSLYDGRTVNAQVPADGPPNVVSEIRFAFGDLSDWGAAPLGIAADARFVWHELGHVLLIAATGSPEFRFAHSPGDALAAIICDLDSKLAEQAPAWRGVTFPWIEALRRHDREACDGWGWHGSLYPRSRDDLRDPGGYRGEQVLSSTLFRLYQALGGDALRADGSPDLLARRGAAAYTVYLVLAAIAAGSVAAIPGDNFVPEAVVTTPMLDGYALAGGMMAVDAARTLVVPNRKVFPPFRSSPWRGGAVHKVARWAFEQQGLYAPGSGPRTWDGPGQRLPVDVYIEDRAGRAGAYTYTKDWDTVPPHVLVAAQPTPAAPDAPPRRGTTNHVFVRVHNRGTDPNAPPAAVRVFAARVLGGKPPRWRLPSAIAARWVELAPGSGAGAAAIVPPSAVNGVDFGPFEWRPPLTGDHALLACVDAPGDRCNALTATLACAVGPTRLERLVPFDNNIAYRGVVVVP